MSMKIEQKVISEESAKILWELCEEKGIKLPESQYSWLVYKNKSYPSSLNFSFDAESRISGGTRGVAVPAHGVAELGEILRHFTSGIYMPSWVDAFGCWDCPIEKGGIGEFKTEAEARGKMLIYLIENGLIK